MATEFKEDFRSPHRGNIAAFLPRWWTVNLLIVMRQIDEYRRKTCENRQNSAEK